jgi:Mrp family chromosome partitioning ATPase
MSIIVCWSVKGGSGTSVVAAGLALLAARQPSGALLVDLDGDQPGILGQPDRAAVGVRDWLVEGGAAPPDALGRLEAEVAPGLRLLPAGTQDALANAGGGSNGTPAGVLQRVRALTLVAAAEQRTVVVDAGPAGRDGGGLASLVHEALRSRRHRSVLVVRPCYLALRRMVSLGRVDALAVVAEPWRALTLDEVTSVVDAPVVVEVPVEAAVGRAVDAGTLARRTPRSLLRALRDLSA